MKFCVLLLVFSFILVSCGTDTGNPGMTPVSGEDGASEFMPSFVEGTCNKLKFCHTEMDLRECGPKLIQEANMPLALGFLDLEFKNLTEVYQAEVRREILPHASFSDQCLLNIQAITCDHPSMNEAYRTGNIRPFEKTHNIVPNICRSAYQYSD